MWLIFTSFATFLHERKLRIFTCLAVFINLSGLVVLFVRFSSFVESKWTYYAYF